MSALRSVVLRASSAVNTGVVAEAAVSDLNSRDFPHLIVVFDVTAIPAGGAPTLDLYLQFSADNGTVWQDMAHTQFTTTATKRWARINGDVAGPTNSAGGTDGSLAGETVNQGPFGGLMRIKSNFVQGGSVGNYTYACTVYLK